MATIQEAYRGVLERGEEWRRRSFATGWTIVVHNGVPYNMRDGQLMDEYKPAAESVFADDWERVQPPTPRPIYLMLPCEKGKGTHMYGDREICWVCEKEHADYRQVAMPLTVADLILLWRSHCRLDVDLEGLATAVRNLDAAIATLTAVPKMT